MGCGASNSWRDHSDGKVLSKVESEQKETIRKEIFIGNLDVAGKIKPRNLRLFISSTFSDTKAERNYLMKHVWPKIASYCSENQVNFMVVDFRWGITDQITKSHKVEDVCLAEVKKCMEESMDSAITFLLLTSHRYGWSPLPRVIPESEFQLLSDLSDEEGIRHMTKMYEKDVNAVPAEFVLSGESDGANQEWLRLKLYNAAKGSQKFSSEEKRRWVRSITHNEVKFIFANKGHGSQFEFC